MVKTDLEIHNKISMALFANLEECVNINALVKKTEYNWRTIRKHLRLMSLGYRERDKIMGRKSK